MSKDVRDAVVQTQRRTWDLDEYRKKAEEQQASKTSGEREYTRAEIEARVNLSARDKGVLNEFDKTVGKQQVVSAAAGASAAGTFYCKVCDCNLKDSVSYLDHINGRRHQAAMGVSMKVERSSVDDVRSKLNSHKRKHDEVKKYDFDERMKRLQQEEEEEKKMKKDRKKRAKTKETDEDPDSALPGTNGVPPEEEIDVFAAMGLPSGFGSSKK